MEIYDTHINHQSQGSKMISSVMLFNINKQLFNIQQFWSFCNCKARGIKGITFIFCLEFSFSSKFCPSFPLHLYYKCPYICIKNKEPGIFPLETINFYLLYLNALFVIARCSTQTHPLCYSHFFCPFFCLMTPLYSACDLVSASMKIYY